MRFPLKLAPAQVQAPKQTPTPSKQGSFAERLAAGQAAPASPEDEALQKELIEQYLLQNTLMQRIMATPGPLPDRETD